MIFLLSCPIPANTVLKRQVFLFHRNPKSQNLSYNSHHEWRRMCYFRPSKCVQYLQYGTSSGLYCVACTVCSSYSMHPHLVPGVSIIYGMNLHLVQNVCNINSMYARLVPNVCSFYSMYLCLVPNVSSFYRMYLCLVPNVSSFYSMYLCLAPNVSSFYSMYVCLVPNVSSFCGGFADALLSH